MTVVSDTSPLNYLVQIGAIEILFQLFESINIPGAVRDELLAIRAPAATQDWIANPPAGMIIHDLSFTSDPTLARIHAGEREAIQLAERLGADLTLLDDRMAREIALARGIPVAGTLAVLDEAGTRGMVHIPTSVHRLRNTSFRARPALYDWLLDRHPAA
ncbi:MAG: hypothetical protein SH809_11800 [Rhodothermales bacterium]|nr:hypothetical protein [Rhodothermales bacterium]